MTIKEKIKRSVKYKFRITFLISILLGNIMSILVIIPYCHHELEDLFTDNYNVIITKLKEYEDDEDKLKVVIDTYENLSYKIQVKDDISNLELSQNQKNTLNKNGRIIYLTKKIYKNQAIAKIKNKYFLISIDNDKNHHIGFLPLLINSWILLITILVSFCILSFVTKKLIEPIEKLAKATNKIADGDYDVKIETKGKDEIGKLINNFNLMANELKNIDYMQKDFINNVSHEFKTPIAAIKGYLTILKNENISQEERLEYINIVLDEINRLSYLSTNILELSKLDNMDTFEGNEKFSLDEQIRKTVILMEKEWSKKNISLNLDLQPTYYYGKEDYLNQVWLNIINNAIKFSYENSIININYKKNANEVIVVIEDFGCGMDEKTQKYLFNRFYQGDYSRNDCGYGLGLAICKKIVELSNGSISVESELGKYTRFIIKLPF